MRLWSAGHREQSTARPPSTRVGTAPPRTGGGQGEGRPCGRLARRPINTQQAPPGRWTHRRYPSARGRDQRVHSGRAPLTAEFSHRSVARFGAVREPGVGAGAAGVSARWTTNRCGGPVAARLDRRSSSLGPSTKGASRRENALANASTGSVNGGSERRRSGRSSVPVAPCPSASPSAPQAESPAASGSWQCPEIRDQH